MTINKVMRKFAVNICILFNFATDNFSLIIFEKTTFVYILLIIHIYFSKVLYIYIYPFESINMFIA